MAKDTAKQPVAVTIFIPTYNGDEYILQLINNVLKQKFKEKYEVLIIDSGSSDDTLQIIKQFPEIRLHEIPNKEFGHGKTRNLAAKLASGNIVVYLTQDAVPAHDKWLESMVEPFHVSDTVACVFGKQIPRADCVAPIKREVSSVFSDLGPDNSLMIHRRKSLLSNEQIKHPMNFMSDVNSAVRKDILLNDVPFRDVNYAEDQALGIDILKAGYLKAYAPMGSVLHSHNYPLKKYFHRKFDEMIGLKDATGHVQPTNMRAQISYLIKSTIRDCAFVIKDGDYSTLSKAKNLFLSPLYNLAFCRARSLSSKADTQETIRKNSLEAKQRNK